MEKVIVTGGAGFIGSHLAEELVRRGYNKLNYKVDKDDVYSSC